jgi:hypothetical protein
MIVTDPLASGKPTNLLSPLKVRSHKSSSTQLDEPLGTLCNSLLLELLFMISRGMSTIPLNNAISSRAPHQLWACYMESTSLQAI